jgi:hypothetical protein
MIKSELDLLGTEEYKKVIKYFYDNIHFDCGFKNNNCIAYKPFINSNIQHNQIMCCCENCKNMKGYFRKTEEAFESFSIVKNSFNKNTGFWRKNIGCVLPREFRSFICNFHVCYQLREKLSEEEYKLLSILRDHGQYDIERFMKECKK